MTAYAEAGVSLEAAERLSTWLRPRVGGLFGGMVDAGELKSFDSPILVSSMDGIGTKARLARQLNRLEGLGYDIVHHCVNDIAVHGAKPLFFLDYLAFSAIEEHTCRVVIESIGNACTNLGISLAGGETAEMPAVYQPGEFDVAGSIVGVAEKDRVVDGSAVAAGDVILGLSSNGPHTNGFSLIQRLFGPDDYQQPVAATGSTLGAILLEPHRCYYREITRLLDGSGVHGLTHITGGGVPGNVARIVPDGLQAVITIPQWPEIFEIIHSRGVSRDEMTRVFNLGIGLVAICDPTVAGRADAEWRVIGYVNESSAEGRVRITG